MARKDPNLQIALQEGWSSACQLYEHLLRGGDLAVLPPSAVRLQPDELPHSDAMLGYARFYGMNVSYERNNMFLFGSASFVAAGLTQAVAQAAQQQAQLPPDSGGVISGEIISDDAPRALPPA